MTTENHPFYVQGRGFINAGNLLVGDKLISVNGEDLFVEKHRIEELHEPATVYNFQVEDYHTYFVGDCAVWVHNKNCTPENKQSLKEHLEGTADNTGAKPNGTINGCHEESHFLSELDIAGGDLTDNIQNVSGIDGVTYVEYTANTKTGKATKTIYDSNVISTDDFIDRGLDAYANVPESVSGGPVTALDNSGKAWNLYIRDNKLITMYPSV
ncbi:polymorphic toxin-type HINT domain-containing protein [Ruminococcus bicirculans (ex Wegman et al. 2014)]|uniref:polymorphic toxin-type HINT domain-containing protein n=1 Tax=Ruminococcus bicirculans (ex Wegman et al. 2014) TaxID=1160721 RepID=UPI00325B1103